MNKIDCIRLRRGTICRLDMKPCKDNCPLQKTKEEYLNSIKNDREDIRKS